MKKNVMIIGAGEVAHVAGHKAAMNNDVLGDICIASRTRAKCDAIIDSVARKGHLKDPSGRLYSAQLDALDIPATVKLIKESKTGIVINLGSAFLNMSVLEACIETGRRISTPPFTRIRTKSVRSHPGMLITNGSGKIDATKRG